MIKNGVDIVQISRITSILSKDSFLKHYFTEQEIRYIQSKKNKDETIAGIYASKEAFLKAIQTGISSYPLIDIEICHQENGAPYIVLHNTIKKDIDFKNMSVSISHDGEYAIAYVVIVL